MSVVSDERWTTARYRDVYLGKMQQKQKRRGAPLRGLSPLSLRPAEGRGSSLSPLRGCPSTIFL